MKKLDQAALRLLDNRALFEEIHQLKSAFVALFSNLANDFAAAELSAVHPSSRGTKISKGNELENCPYQVLDIIRDFDKRHGFNIRLLNWWGRGLFIFVFFGEQNERILPDLLRHLQSHGYLQATTSSPWDYKHMIDGHRLEAIDPDKSAILRNKFHHLQLVKKIPYGEDFHSLKLLLKEQVDQILNFYRG